MYLVLLAGRPCECRRQCSKTQTPEKRETMKQTTITMRSSSFILIILWWVENIQWRPSSYWKCLLAISHNKNLNHVLKIYANAKWGLNWEACSQNFHQPGLDWPPATANLLRTLRKKVSQLWVEATCLDVCKSESACRSCFLLGEPVIIWILHSPFKR